MFQYLVIWPAKRTAMPCGRKDLGMKRPTAIELFEEGSDCTPEILDGVREQLNENPYLARKYLGLAAYRQSDELVELLLSPKEVQSSDNDWGDVICELVSNGEDCVRLVERLLDFGGSQKGTFVYEVCLSKEVHFGCDSQDSYAPPLYLCIECPSVLVMSLVEGTTESSLMMLKRADILVDPEDGEPSSLMIAAALGRLEEMRVLLARPTIDVAYRDKEGRDALDCAVYACEYWTQGRACIDLLLARPEFSSERRVEERVVVRGRALNDPPSEDTSR